MPDYREREREVTRVSLAFTWMLRPGPPFRPFRTIKLPCLAERDAGAAMRRKAVFPLKADIVLCVRDGGYSSLPAHDRPIINYQAVANYSRYTWYVIRFQRFRRPIGYNVQRRGTTADWFDCSSEFQDCFHPPFPPISNISNNNISPRREIAS